MLAQNVATPWKEDGPVWKNYRVVDVAFLMPIVTIVSASLYGIMKANAKYAKLQKCSRPPNSAQSPAKHYEYWHRTPATATMRVPVEAGGAVQCVC